MPHRYELTEPAQADIESIAEYTASKWGFDQAGAYLDLLIERFIALALQPEIGIAHFEFGEAVRAFPAGSHIIYYQQTDFGVLVLRVLHQRQDPFRQFDAS